MLREQLAERLGSDEPDPESHELATLAGDLAGLYMAVKEGLLRIPEHAARELGFVIWNWTFGFETDAGKALHQRSRRAAASCNPRSSR
jgi:hypothetical protein